MMAMKHRLEQNVLPGKDQGSLPAPGGSVGTGGLVENCPPPAPPEVGLEKRLLSWLVSGAPAPPAGRGPASLTATQTRS